MLKYQHACLWCTLKKAKITSSFKRTLLMVQLANHYNIILSNETLLLLYPLSDFKDYGFLNACKYTPANYKYLSLILTLA